MFNKGRWARFVLGVFCWFGFVFLKISFGISLTNQVALKEPLEKNAACKRQRQINSDQENPKNVWFHRILFLSERRPQKHPPSSLPACQYVQTDQGVEQSSSSSEVVLGNLAPFQGSRAMCKKVSSWHILSDKTVSKTFFRKSERAVISCAQNFCSQLMTLRNFHVLFEI